MIPLALAAILEDDEEAIQVHEVWALELSPSQLFFKQQQQGPSKCRGAICLPIFVGFGINLLRLKGWIWIAGYRLL